MEIQFSIAWESLRALEWLFSTVWVGEAPYIKEFGFYFEGDTERIPDKKSFAYKLFKKCFLKNNLNPNKLYKFYFHICL